MAEQLERSHSGTSDHRLASTDADQQQEIARKGRESASAEKRGRSADRERVAPPNQPPEPSAPWQEPRGIQRGIADADKMARSGSTEETVRDTPPAGAWNDTSAD